MKLCKDCKHYRHRAFSSPECLHPNNVKIFLVDGSKSLKCPCWFLREGKITDHSLCGIDAKWYEAR